MEENKFTGVAVAVTCAKTGQRVTVSSLSRFVVWRSFGAESRTGPVELPVLLVGGGSAQLAYRGIRPTTVIIHWVLFPPVIDGIESRRIFLTSVIQHRTVIDTSLSSLTTLVNGQKPFLLRIGVLTRWWTCW